MIALKDLDEKPRTRLLTTIVSSSLSNQKERREKMKSMKQIRQEARYSDADWRIFVFLLVIASTPFLLSA